MESKLQGRPLEGGTPHQGTVYLVCFAKAQTGGPEAIHQLAHTLRAQGRDARIVYMTFNDFNAVEQSPGIIAAHRIQVMDVPDKKPVAYDIYETVGETEMVDLPENTLVFPEAIPALHRLGARMRKCMWWLSVDNAERGIRQMGGMEALKAQPILHLVQSTYAERFLEGHGIAESYPLYDFTSPVFFATADPRPRLDRIVYNPSKGLEFVRALVSAAPDLPWTPIVRMTPAQVRDLLQTSKLYIDFGHHPGKDRIPREAAISGCCVLTNRRGAANYFRDVPIDEQYKFDDSAEAIPAVIAKIRDVLKSYDTHTKNFAYWRRCIRSEREEFETQVSRLFG